MECGSLQSRGLRRDGTRGSSVGMRARDGRGLEGGVRRGSSRRSTREGRAAMGVGRAEVEASLQHK